MQAIELTSARYHTINPNRVGLIDEAEEGEAADHFLANRASLKHGGPTKNPARINNNDDIKQGRKLFEL